MTMPPLGWAAVAAVAQGVLAVRRRPTVGSITVGALLGAGALAVGLAPVVQFRRSGTTINPVAVDRASTLVTTGIYRHTRNPMYVAMAGGLVAHAVLRRSPATLLPVVGFVAALNRRQIPAEEAALTDRFGAEYQDYCRDVPRWLGPVRPSDQTPAGGTPA
ncbi:methyltransferase family protein [Cellulomonas denverensis]|nr:isoprenylcysteine carboxylmethyltransferase family protein [Cellulomonas denverensis]GIG24941.1 hypothetical protein Cde04nite_11850 [Cellulomonas denverensis]